MRNVFHSTSSKANLHKPILTCTQFTSIYFLYYKCLQKSLSNHDLSFAKVKHSPFGLNAWTMNESIFTMSILNSIYKVRQGSNNLSRTENEVKID